MGIILTVCLLLHASTIPHATCHRPVTATPERHPVTAQRWWGEERTHPWRT